MFCDFLTVPWVGLRCVIVVFPDHTHFFVIVSVLRLFLTVPWFVLQCVIVVFPDHSHLFFVMDETDADLSLSRSPTNFLYLIPYSDALGGIYLIWYIYHSFTYMTVKAA